MHVASYAHVPAGKILWRYLRRADILLECELLRPKIHGYTACKRTGFVKPDSIKLAMGHLRHGEVAP